MPALARFLVVRKHFSFDEADYIDAVQIEFLVAPRASEFYCQDMPLLILDFGLIENGSIRDNDRPN